MSKLKCIFHELDPDSKNARFDVHFEYKTVDTIISPGAH